MPVPAGENDPGAQSLTHPSLLPLANQSSPTPPPADLSSLASARTACVWPLNVLMSLSRWKSRIMLSAAPA